MGVKGPKKNEMMMMEDVSYRETMPRAAGKKTQAPNYQIIVHSIPPKITAATEQNFIPGWVKEL